jgi:hypothetical protein
LRGTGVRDILATVIRKNAEFLQQLLTLSRARRKDAYEHDPCAPESRHSLNRDPDTCCLQVTCENLIERWSGYSRARDTILLPEEIGAGP